MRILYLIDEMEAITAGGTERQVLQMIRLVREAGLEPQLAVMRGTGWLTEVQAGCPVEHFRISSFTSVAGLRELARLRRWVRKQRFHVLQTFFLEANLVGPVVAWLAGVPVILGSRRNMNYWMGWKLAALQRLANLFATRLVANCRAVADCIVRMEKVRASKVDVIYNGIDLEYFRPCPEQRAQMRSQLGIAEDEVLVGNVSALRPIKGVEHFVSAAAAVLQHESRARFVLVGDGPLRQQLQDQAARLGIAPRFLIAGAQEDIRPWLNACDVAVLTSESEGFSNSILEYMAMGLACVATDVGGNREVLTEGAGVLVPQCDDRALAEALLHLVRNPKRRQMAQVARSTVARFGLPSAREALAHYYRGWMPPERHAGGVPQAEPAKDWKRV